MFFLDPVFGFFSIPDPGVKMHRIPDSDPQHRILYTQTAYYEKGSKKTALPPSLLP
jgi:hypothetical protein